MIEPDANGWMPIETAPKDDTEVMLHDGVRPGFGHYWYPADLIDQGHWYGTRVHRPTHWRPLPKPPVQS